MKVGIVTLYDAYNCGSFLQAFALQEFMKKQGYETYLLDCSRDRLRFLKRIAATSPRRQMLKLKRRLAYGRAWKKLQVVRWRKKMKFDAVVVGSDEIWSIANPYFEHWPQYFAIGIQAVRIVAYAPSIGYTEPEDILKEQSLCEGIRTFSNIFARDERTRRAAEIIVGKKISRVCDPTLLPPLHWEDWEREYPLNFEGPFLLVYSYSDQLLCSQEAICYAKQRKCKVVSAAFDCQWADQVIIPDPFQFLWLIHHSYAVLTSTFHGSVFSTYYQKKFAVSTNMQKTLDFLEMTEQIDRLYRESGDLERILEETEAYGGIEFVEEQRRFSGEMLLKAIESNKLS